MADGDMKIVCSKCRVERDRSMFRAHKGTISGLDSWPDMPEVSNG